MRAARAFTLVEILIAVFIAIIIFTIGFTILSGTIRARNDAAARLRATENARLFFQMLERDLAAAYPYNQGSYPVYRKEDLCDAIPGGTADPYSITVGETISGGIRTPITIQTFPLQFYTRIDHRDTLNSSPDPDDRVFVRYYINNRQVQSGNHTVFVCELCREVQHFVDPTNPAELDVKPFTDTTFMNSQDNAMFDRVRSLKVTPVRWKPDTKSYEDPAVSPATATHLKIRLIMNDAAGSIQVSDTGEVYLSTPESQQTIQDGKDMGTRAITKILPIPSAFTE